MDTLIIRDRIWSRAAAIIYPGTRREENPIRVLSSQELYELVTYGVSSETRDSLNREFLDSYSSQRKHTESTTTPWAITTRSPRSIGLVALVVVVLLLGGIALAGIPVPLDSTSDRPANDVLATPVSQAGTPAATTPTRIAIPASCPTPPVASHPASLRPAVRTGATSGGLDGWEYLLSQNTSYWEFDPNDQRADVVPEERHIAVYRGPGGVHYRFIADRWPTGAKASQKRGINTEGIAIRWGRYVLTVDATNATDFSIPDAHELLTAVPSPDGPQLGEQCVAALADQATDE